MTGDSRCDANTCYGFSNLNITHQHGLRGGAVDACRRCRVQRPQPQHQLGERRRHDAAQVEVSTQKQRSAGRGIKAEIVGLLGLGLVGDKEDLRPQHQLGWRRRHNAAQELPAEQQRRARDGTLSLPGASEAHSVCSHRSVSIATKTPPEEVSLRSSDLQGR